MMRRNSMDVRESNRRNSSEIMASNRRHSTDTMSINSSKKKLIRQKATEQYQEVLTEEPLEDYSSHGSQNSSRSGSNEGSQQLNAASATVKTSRSLSESVAVDPNYRAHLRRKARLNSGPARLHSKPADARGGGFQMRKQSSVISYPFQSRVAFIQGDSSSMIDVPVFIGTSLDLATIPITSQRVVVTPASALQGAATIRPRQQIDLTRRNSRPEKSSRPSYLRPMWIMICFIILCLALAGYILSFNQEVPSKISEESQRNVSHILEAITNTTSRDLENLGNLEDMEHLQS